jgi:hypothetical protein
MLSWLQRAGAILPCERPGHYVKTSNRSRNIYIHPHL